jgi:hypothetical protein
MYTQSSVMLICKVFNIFSNSLTTIVNNYVLLTLNRVLLFILPCIFVRNVIG